MEKAFMRFMGINNFMIKSEIKNKAAKVRDDSNCSYFFPRITTVVILFHFGKQDCDSLEGNE
jgi:hypothetical protein